MKVELINIQYSKSLSVQTLCFAADVVIDGEPAGRVRNLGMGGRNEYTPVELERVLNDYASSLPDQLDYIPDGRNRLIPIPFRPTAEHLVNDLLIQHLAGKAVTLFKEAGL